jgi:pSer/pThr/pTyr-binding forkhead associated (FHA) protein
VTRAAELKAQIELERQGEPFLLFRSGEGEQRLVVLAASAPASPITIGRREETDVSLSWDSEVSRLHCTIERVGGDWVLVDDGLSRNGTFVNGARMLGRHRLEDGDRLCFGETVVLYRNPGGGQSYSTSPLPASALTVPLTPTQHKVLVALCRPVNDSAFATPATNREIAEEVMLSVDAVKAQLRVLFDRFGLEALPQNQKRARLAASTLVGGLLSPRDF